MFSLGYFSGARSVIAAFVLGIVMASGVSAQSVHSSAGIVRSRSATTGRAGNAVLSSRTLVDKQGDAVLELVTAGPETEWEPRGYIAKAQVKLYDGEGELAWTKNHLETTQPSYVAYPYPRLVRGQSYAVQANIRGVDGNRTNVVTTHGIVLASPDLVVRSLSVPRNVTIGLPIEVLATIGEANGDTGASADCVLKVGGVEVDRARDIWIDAGSAAECAFVAESSALGPLAIEVAVENVSPREWDGANNTAQASVFVRPALEGGVAVARHNMAYWSSRSLSEGYYLHDTAGQDEGRDWRTEELHENAAQTYATFSVESPNEWLTFPAHVQAEVKLDDVSYRTFDTDVPVTLEESDEFGNSVRMGLLVDEENGSVVQVASLRSNGTGVDVMLVGVFGTARVFLSQNYQRYWIGEVDGEQTDVYVQNDIVLDETRVGALVLPEQSVSWDVVFESGDYVFAKSSYVPVELYREDQVQPYSCVDLVDEQDEYIDTQRWCSEYESHFMSAFSEVVTPL